MRGKWTASLALSLGFLVQVARGEDGWRPPPLRPGDVSQAMQRAATPPAALQRPVPQSSSVAVPAVTLDRPIPLPDPGVVDPALRLTAFSPAPSDFPLVYRSQSPEAPGSRPFSPSGPVAQTPGMVTTWRRAPAEGSSAPEPDPVPSGMQSAPSSGPNPAIWSMFTQGNCDVNAPACGPCGTNCCGSCYGLGNRYYGSAEYILWWIKGSPLPPLVTAGSAADLIPGALGLPGTVVLFGGSSVGTGARSGGRFTLGHWFDEDHVLGIEGSYFFLGTHNTNFSATSFGSPVLARPFIDAATGMETAEGVAGGPLVGTITASLRSSLWGAEANLRSNLCCGCNWNVDVLAGFRAAELNETLNINENLLVIRGAGAGGSFLINDHFNAKNNFYGGQLGAVAEYRYGKWLFDLKTKVALGTTTQEVHINGSTLINDPVRGASLSTGGLLAQPSNIGRYSRDAFTWMPEVGLNVGYQFTPRLRGYVGYNFLYWSDVARPGNQIDRVVNVNQIPPAIPGGPARPEFRFVNSDFWAQGINFGLEFRY